MPQQEGPREGICPRTHCSGFMQLCTLFSLQRQVRKLRTDCSTVGLYCVTITWQQIFKVHFVAGVSLACDCWTQTSCQAMQRDSGKPHTFILCEKKHEWICSNVSTIWKIHC